MVKLDLKNNSSAVLDALNQQILKTLEECGLVAENYAKDNCTQKNIVDTGNLRNSITHTVVTGEKAVYVGTNVEYGIYNEFGTGVYADTGGRQSPWVYQDYNGDWHKTSGMKPRPFIRPAVADNVDKYEKIIKNNLKGL